MLLAYVDESYDEDLYFLAAAIGDEFQWHLFETELQGIRDTTAAAHGLAPGFEFHAYELMSGSGEWKLLRGKHREAAGIYRAVLLAANHSGIKFIFRGLDLNGARERRGYLSDPHGEVLMHLLEQIELHAIRKNEPDLVRVIADEISIQSELQNQFRGYREVGTWGYRTLKLEHIATPITFASSRSEVGLQLVDFAVYLHRRREAATDTHIKALTTVRRLAHEIDRLTIHHYLWPLRTRAPH